MDLNLYPDLIQQNDLNSNFDHSLQACPLHFDFLNCKIESSFASVWIIELKRFRGTSFGIHGSCINFIIDI
ncbi:hypothetical protein BpHYR1_036761 [Brachionus plicatilis]|uniref:Uncharacterized protein n=1 Tax=Brachionus plicatilis TaxID=10195 RepID=A0A3M7QKB0_BRAPC|nr:hypothetical protein BpHYR1_036761 [Brachionus plicatilis]